MKILLVSSYELGHQPYHLATAAAALRAGGKAVRAIDLSLQELDESSIKWADGFAFAVPMHTAMQTALAAEKAVRAVRPGVPTCFFGLYALSAELPPGATGIAGEYEKGLVAWAEGTHHGKYSETGRSVIQTAPDRSDLRGLESYVGVDVAGERRVVGSTAATRGCRHLCLHCPVPVVYGGRFRVVDSDHVIADIAAQVAAGARHISFSDPDFLNGPKHAVRILERAREVDSTLTFDATIKVEHLLKYRNLIPRLAELGMIFVVSAFETTNDVILELLDKGHTTADMVEAVHALHSNAIDVRPTWLPFTPWTAMSDLVDMLYVMEEHDLDVDPIQLTIRLLIPRNSLLVNLSPDRLTLGEYNDEALSYRWTSADPALDDLQRRLAEEYRRVADGPRSEALAALTGEILRTAGLDEQAIRLSSGEGRPRLTEPWFC